MANGSVVCVGELLIDFFCTDVDVNLVEGSRFLKSAGGAPANVCAAVAKLGGRTSFSGKVGKDPFGTYLKHTLDEVGVDTSMLIMDESIPTTLAFVSLKKNGDRDFVFNRGADAHLHFEEVDQAHLEEAAILHFGSATAMLSDPFYTTYFKLIKEASERGTFISFDPNFRGDLWKERRQDFIDRSKEAIQYSDFVKVSDEELDILTGESVLEKGVRALHDIGAQIVAVTLGKKGTFLSSRKENHLIPSIPITSVDSTGAGDAFVGATLYQLAQTGQPKDTIHQFSKLKEIIAFSNRVGALVCTKMGAIAALPTITELETWKD